MDECGRPYGCLNPLARQLETYLTPSWIDRQLGRLSAVLGVLLIHLLECRKVLGEMHSYSVLSAVIISSLLTYLLLDSLRDGASPCAEDPACAVNRDGGANREISEGSQAPQRQRGGFPSGPITSIL